MPLAFHLDVALELNPIIVCLNAVRAFVHFLYERNQLRGVHHWIARDLFSFLLSVWWFSEIYHLCFRWSDIIVTAQGTGLTLHSHKCVLYRYRTTCSCLGQVAAESRNDGCFFVWPYEGNSFFKVAPNAELLDK